MTALVTKSSSLTLFGIEVPVTSDVIKLTWEQMEQVSSALDKARDDFVNSLDFINNESVSINDIGDINRFWFELHELISDIWFDGMSVTDIESRFNKLIENARR